METGRIGFEKKKNKLRKDGKMSTMQNPKGQKKKR